MESLKLHKTRLNSFIVVSHYILFVKMLQLTYLAMIFIWHALLICVWCAWYKELKWKELSVWIYFALCRRKWTEHKTKCQDGWTHVAERVAKFFNGIHSVCYFCRSRFFCFQMNRDVSYAQVLSDYVATKDGELTVLKGDIVQLLGCSGQTHRICRKTNDQSLIVDGLLPSHVLMLKDITDNGFRYVLLADSCIRGHLRGGMRSHC